ncbi:uncharacterized mitochondrial protein AtMg00810-like [Rhododendron vialii]|uniref:uncharacterized mitochondrial protein AtMg00810-like n=1 Tax=Rhododendron vialii TaxID=182163 RepID=UPI00265E2293|nr:uncharacterized mitochondrial protein AtMg00810-like [Rhododendron vialii]
MFSNYLLQLGFQSSKADTSLFLLPQGNHLTLVLIYVDDIVITGSDSSYITSLIQKLSQRFVMKDLGTLNYFLGIEITSSSSGIFLSQAKYASELLAKAGMIDCKGSESPASVKPGIPDYDSPLEDVSLYRTLVGSLQYLTLTRPEISFSVNVACQHMHAPKLSHFIALKRILRYIKGSIHQGLHFVQGPLTLTAFADADWAGDPVDRRSTTGYGVFMGHNLVSWCAKKQHTVARSSTEAEYRAMAQTASELVWLQQLFSELLIPSSTPHVLWCDNKSAIALACNPVYHARTKHIELDYHFIREQVLNNQVVLYHINSEAQLADIFTKPLSVSRFQLLKSKLMVANPPMCLQGSVKESNVADQSSTTATSPVD